MKNILILDNYDSFTYNLYHLVKELSNDNIEVIRNDQLTVEDADAFDKIILSPGPGIPEEAGLLLPIIKKYAPHKSILGVCLGHQAIGQSFGATLTNLSNVYHGLQSEIDIIADDPLFSGLGTQLAVGRYHSWVIHPDSLPEELIITAMSKENQIMGIRHKQYDVHGIQFHPESILTPQGKVMMQNFLRLTK